MPKDDVVVLDIVIASGPDGEAGVLTALVGEFSRGPQRFISVLGHPDGLGGEDAPFIVERMGRHHQNLGRHRVEFVADGLARHRVFDGRVDDFEGTGSIEVDVIAAGLANRGGLDFEGTAERVEVRIGGDRDTVVVDDAVSGSIQCRADANIKQMLVVDCHDSGSNDGSPWCLHAFGHGQCGMVETMPAALTSMCRLADWSSTKARMYS